MDPSRVVVDTNIVFAALLRRESRVRESLLTDARQTFYAPRYVVVEIFKQKERIAAASELIEEELLDCLNALLARIKFVDEAIIPIGTWMEARRLCVGVDLKDAPFVSLMLHVDGLLWTNDTELKAGLRLKGCDRFFLP